MGKNTIWSQLSDWKPSTQMITEPLIWNSRRMGRLEKKIVKEESLKKR